MSEETFAQEDWQLLRNLVYLVFFTVAGADGEVSIREVRVFLGMMTSWMMNPDPLLRRLLKDMGETEEGGLAEYKRLLAALQENPWSGPEALERAKSLLQGRLSPDEYQRFVGSLLLCGLWIARPDILDGGPSEPVGEEEARALTKLNHHFELDPDAVREHIGMYEEVEELIGYRFA
ncbi:MAG: hypothetical protein V3S20_06225 [Dehalococcoidia bacterium]